MSPGFEEEFKKSLNFLKVHVILSYKEQLGASTLSSSMSF